MGVGEDGPPVVSSGLVIDLWRATELANCDDQSFIQQSALLEIGN